ncbi:MAG: translation elongation factor Ts, partial [Ignavibacteriaceae bacterium]
IHNPSSVDELFSKEALLQVKLDEIIGKIGEKIVISRIGITSLENGYVGEYVHPGSKLGVLITFENLAKDKFEILAGAAKEIAMQVAAMKPITVYRNEVDQNIVDKEIEIYKELARKEGKPEQILEKISTGRINKFYQENCLNEQAFIKDNTKSVGDLLKEINTKAGTDVKIKSFLRYHLGDEKK